MSPEHDWWRGLTLIGVVGAVGYLLNALASGVKLWPAQELIRHIGKAGITGLVTAGLWALIDEFTAATTGVGIAVAAAVAVLGVDGTIALVRRVAEQKTGLDLGGEEKNGHDDAPDSRGN